MTAVPAYVSPARLPHIAGMTAAVRPDFDREQWTTCRLGRLTPGTVIALPDGPVRPLVLTATRTEDVPGDFHAWMVGEARHIDTAAVEEFKLRADTSVPTRCDLHYTATTTNPPEEG